jgi:mono/diheme cytochrome c family protein
MFTHERPRFITLFIAAGLIATPSIVSAQQTGSLAEGARIYGKVCGSCHNARSPLERSDRDWITIINHMRVRANMTGTQVRDVLAFVQATNQNPARIAVLPPPPPSVQEDSARREAPPFDPGTLDSAERGKRLVAEKACLGCHVVGDEGGNIGPSLNDVVRLKGAEYVHQKVANPTFDRETSMMPNFGLTAEEIDWVVAYLATLDE